MIKISQYKYKVEETIGNQNLNIFPIHVNIVPKHLQKSSLHEETIAQVIYVCGLLRHIF